MTRNVFERLGIKKKVVTAGESYFYGIKPIRMIWHGEWSDPELKYGRRVVNYYDVEDYFWADYKDYLESEHKDFYKIPDNEDDDFAAYIYDRGDDVKAYISGAY